MTKRWHILREGDVWALARTLPLRFDVVASGVLPLCHPVRLMHQIRQDIWRALQRVRGFSPAVRLTPAPAGWQVAAGGRVLGPVAPVLEARLCAVLERPDNRARWIRHAGPWEVTP